MDESSSNNESENTPEKGVEVERPKSTASNAISSERARQEEPKIEKVISGEAIRRKKSLGTRFKGVFFGGDAKSVVENVFNDVLLPAAKEMVSDAISRSIDGMLFGIETHVLTGVVVVEALVAPLPDIFNTTACHRIAETKSGLVRQGDGSDLRTTSKTFWCHRDVTPMMFLSVWTTSSRRMDSLPGRIF